MPSFSFLAGLEELNSLWVKCGGYTTKCGGYTTKCGGYTTKCGGYTMCKVIITSNPTTVEVDLSCIEVRLGF